MKAGVNCTLREIPLEELAQALRQALPIHWMKCVKARGEYFEGSHLVVDPEGDHGLVVHQDDSGESAEDDEVDSSDEN